MRECWRGRWGRGCRAGVEAVCTSVGGPDSPGWPALSPGSPGPSLSGSQGPETKQLISSDIKQGQNALRLRLIIFHLSHFDGFPYSLKQ